MERKPDCRAEGNMAAKADAGLTCRSVVSHKVRHVPRGSLRSRNSHKSEAGMKRALR
ncbi:hypothetical protein CLOSTHATH_06701 [Hungatella hathewayi DSM 13479]|uniref:Uncharacterized protein n=1 Tax=Hungatella hathewayi DSM 13479 TaxID=566550 RepID=D3ASU3_9FIRM|nr:hypothetical protein CLOSTHATH_06701 [Hungatella hathewayi DSM 13479]